MKIGIICAMDSEAALLYEAMGQTSDRVIAGMKFRSGKIGNTDVTVVRCGIGKVNAAVSVQILADCFEITHLINSGIAGSLDPEINIGDLVVSTDAVVHDFSVGELGYPPGQIPGFDFLAFPADETLRRVIADTIRTAVPNIQLFEGRIASGDQFIASAEKKNWIRETFHAECTEMEGAAVAQAAYLNGIPFVICRYISDKANGDAAVNYAAFEEEAAMHSARLILAVLERL